MAEISTLPEHLLSWITFLWSRATWCYSQVPFPASQFSLVLPPSRACYSLLISSSESLPGMGARRSGFGVLPTVAWGMMLGTDDFPWWSIMNFMSLVHDLWYRNAAALSLLTYYLVVSYTLRVTLSQVDSGFKTNRTHTQPSLRILGSLQTTSGPFNKEIWWLERHVWASAYWPATWSTNSFFWASKGFWIEQDTLLWAPPRTITDVSRLNRPWAFWTMASDSGGRHCPWWSLHWTFGLGYQPLELHRSWMPPSLKPSREMCGSEPNPGKAGVWKIRLTSRSYA